MSRSTQAWLAASLMAMQCGDMTSPVDRAEVVTALPNLSQFVSKRRGATVLFLGAGAGMADGLPSTDDMARSIPDRMEYERSQPAYFTFPAFRSFWRQGDTATLMELLGVLGEQLFDNPVAGRLYVALTGAAASSSDLPDQGIHGYRRRLIEILARREGALFLLTTNWDTSLDTNRASRIPEGSERLRESDSSRPDTPDQRASDAHKRGWDVASGGDRFGALVHFARALELDPMHPASWHDVGACLAIEGYSDLAFTSYCVCEALCAIAPAASVRRGQLLISMKSLHTLLGPQRCDEIRGLVMGRLGLIQGDADDVKIPGDGFRNVASDMFQAIGQIATQRQVL